MKSQSVAVCLLVPLLFLTPLSLALSLSLSLCVAQVFSFPGDLQLRMASITPEDYSAFDTVPG